MKSALNFIINKTFLKRLTKDYFKIRKIEKYVDLIINNATVVDQDLIY